MATAFIAQPRSAVKIGNTRSITVADMSDRGSRTQVQYDAVMGHFRRHPAAWLTGDPFEFGPGGKSFRCGFHLGYFDPEGRMCGIWVPLNGKIEYSAQPPHEAFKREADAVIADYGMFRG